MGAIDTSLLGLGQRPRFKPLVSAKAFASAPLFGGQRWESELELFAAVAELMLELAEGFVFFVAHAGHG